MNPARSTGPALFAGDWALTQLWLFWVAPIAGALLAGWLSRLLQHERRVRAAGDRQALAASLPRPAA